jgi:uncharacterized protein HemY
VAVRQRKQELRQRWPDLGRSQKHGGILGNAVNRRIACKDDDGPVRIILSRTRSEEAEDGRFGGSEGAKRSELC